MRLSRFITGGLCLPLMAPLAPLAAQTTGRAHQSVRVAVVAVASLPGGGRARVLRRVRQTPREVIVLSPQATAADFAVAFHVLAALRQKYGDSLSVDMSAAVRRGAPGAGWEGSAYKLWFEQQLARLGRARVFRVPGIGAARAIAVTLPPLNGRFAAGADSLRRTKK